MANNYIDRDDVKLRIPDVTWGEKYDAILDMVVEEASRDIDLFTGREPGAYAAGDAVARYFTGSGGVDLWVTEMAVAPTEVAVAETGDLTNYTAWAATDYMLWPYNAADKDEPFTRLIIDSLNGTKSLWFGYPKSVKITAQWGYSEDVPASIQRVTMIQSIRSFKRAQQAYQDVGAVVELGQLQYVKGLDPEVRSFLEGSGMKKVTI